MTEKEIQLKIIKYLEGVPDLWFMKAIVSNRRGVPDILVCYKGLFIALEIKADKGKATVLQMYNGRRICTSGGIFKIVRSVDEVKEIIDEVCRLDAVVCAKNGDSRN